MKVTIPLRHLVDLLADAMHGCRSYGEPFEDFLGTAKMHFDEETGKGE
ncbi:MAG: hypothetical protein ACRC33_25240 [Gemmataceae bacterium]